MKKSILYFFILLAGILSTATLQGQTLKGVVKDRMTSQTLPGTSVLIKGTTQGTVTDINGEYSFSLPEGSHTIVFSFIGYTTEELPITISKGQTLNLNVDLYPDITTFDEFVVIGYGTQKKKVVTGSIASVSSEEIASTPILRAEQAMQGRTAGVQVTNLSGQPGEAPTVRIRGAGTTGNPEPLYVVDGLVTDNIEFLNSNDIESIDVLKDAASSAIYGARAANGVVLITTKRGEKGKMQVTYSAYQGIQNAARTLPMLDANQYMMLMNEGARNANQTEPFDLNEIPKHNTNWQKALFAKDAPILNHDLAVTGGNDKSTYSSSINFFSQQGIIGGDKSQFDRLTARLNSRHKTNDFFTFGNNLAYTHIKRRGISSNTSFNGAFSSALNLDPLTPVYMEDLDILAQHPYSSEPVVKDADGRVYGISKLLAAEIVNPLALLKIQNGQTTVDRLVGNLFGEIEFIDGLKFNSSAGIDMSYINSGSFRPLFYLNGAQLNTEKTSVNKTIERYYTWQWENTLTYSKQIDDHNFSALIGTSASRFDYQSLYGFNTQVPITDPNHVYLNMATDTMWDARGGALQAAQASLFGRITYDYQSRYAITAIIRRDGSSKFGANNRYGNFPSIGLSWILSEESFFPEIRNLDIIKLRATYGINGNDRIGDYMFISTMDKSRGYIFGGGRAFGASPSYIENADLRWEESKQLNFASDFGLFNNRLTGTVEYYIKTTAGLLERIPIPAHVGNDPPFSNVGSVQNKGVELSLNWRNNSGVFNYSVGANAAYNKNTMTVIGNEEGILPGASWSVAGMVTRTELGYPIAYFYGYKTDGIFQSQTEVFQHIGSTGNVLQPNAKPGDVRFVDVNKDGVINAEDRTMIGNPNPDWIFGLNGSFNYKQFDLAFLVTGTYGNDIFNGSQRPDLKFTNRTTAALDRWTPENPSSTNPRFTWSDNNNNNRVSDLYIEDGSYARLKNIQIGYTLPKSILTRIKSSAWRFYISAENLFTLTNYTGADPEIGAMSSFDVAIDRGIYPQARTFRLGTSVTF